MFYIYKNKYKKFNLIFCWFFNYKYTFIIIDEKTICVIECLDYLRSDPAERNLVRL